MKKVLLGILFSLALSSVVVAGGESPGDLLDSAIDFFEEVDQEELSEPNQILFLKGEKKLAELKAVLKTPVKTTMFTCKSNHYAQRTCDHIRSIERQDILNDLKDAATRAALSACEESGEFTCIVKRVYVFEVFPPGKEPGCAGEAVVEGTPI